jgi:glucose/mannose-6-phosphate isomerase
MTMIELVDLFPQQLEKALEITKNHPLTISGTKIQSVLITGLGGSGIGGTIVKELVEPFALLPINITKDYSLPKFVNQNTLVIACSYSGNTEETLTVLESALKQNAQIVCVSSGGMVKELAQKNNLNFIEIPGGMPPRSCLGYSLTQILYILDTFSIANINYMSSISEAVKLLLNEKESIKTEAMQLAKQMIGKTPIIYSVGNTEGVSIRFRQQINENGKMLCWHHVLPEMNHNELVAWTEQYQNFIVLIYRYENEYYRNTKRLEICKEVFSKYCDKIIEIKTKGNSDIERAIYAIHLGDWVSCYLAELKNVDASDISIII